MVKPSEHRGSGEKTARRAPRRPGRGRGRLIIIGGHEDKREEKLILRALCVEVGSDRLVVATVASQRPEELWADYEPLFRKLGCPHVHHLRIDSREDALHPRSLRPLEGARAVFFTGGDQLKITSQIGDTPVCTRIREIYAAGGTVAGTSAGASAMSETMLVAGAGEASHRVGAALQMAPGLGLIEGVIIDQHFAERGRIGRLLGAVAQNPRILGLGIDEDTAVIVRGRRFEVVGSGAVYVADGRRITFSNLAEEQRERTMTAFDVKLHILSQGDSFSLTTRRPRARPAEAVEARLEAAR